SASSDDARRRNATCDRLLPPVINPETTASSIQPAVVVGGLIKQFGRFAALRGVTAEFAPGRIYAVLGGNGAGKTTLLRTLAGLSSPTRGMISILGSKDLRVVSRKLGYMAHPSL